MTQNAYERWKEWKRKRDAAFDAALKAKGEPPEAKPGPKRGKQKAQAEEEAPANADETG